MYGWGPALLMAATLVLVLIVRAGPHPYTEVQGLVPASFSPPALPSLVREPSLHPTLSVATAKRFDPILHGPQVPRMRPAKTHLASRAVARPPLPPVHRSATAPHEPCGDGFAVRTLGAGSGLAAGFPHHSPHHPPQQLRSLRGLFGLRPVSMSR